jgi:hypothetical protein
MITEEMKALEALFLDVSPPLEFSTREPQIASLSSCYSSASHIEHADASWKGESADAMQATDAEGQFWEAEIFGAINFLPDNNYFLEENNSCKDAAMVRDTRPMPMDVRNEKILMVDVDVGIK